MRRADRRRRPPRGRDGPRPRLGRRGRRAHQRAARRLGRPRPRDRHDRRDARARARERRRGGRRERRVPQGLPRGPAAARRIGRRRDLQLRHQPRRRQAHRPRRGGARAQARRALRGLRRHRRPGHGRGDPRRHGGLDRLRRRRADRGRVPRRARGRRAGRRRDSPDASRPRARRLGDHPRAQALVSDDLQLNGPQTLYRRWEDSQWSPFAIDLERDREQWPAMEDAERELVHFVLASLMVAEERITTKFSGLVGAHGSEEEATFLATQQVDEARHMQFYARFQDEVVAEPQAIGAHIERARQSVSDAFRQIFDIALVEAHEALRGRPGDLSAKVRFVTIYHLVLEGTLGLTSFKFITDYLRGASLLPGFVDGYSKIHDDETRLIAYGVWFLRSTVAAHPEQADTVRATLRELLPAVAESLRPPGDGAAQDLLGVRGGAVRAYALQCLARRVTTIGAPIKAVVE